jgi:hypothetical protein
MGSSVLEGSKVVIADNLNNWLKWGRLVESWALGTKPLPASVDDFKAQVKHAGIDMVVPDCLQQIAVARHDENVLTLSLPNVAAIEASRRCMEDTARRPSGYRHYPLPDYYALAFKNAPVTEFSEGELINFNTRRVGEYAIGFGL